MSGYSDVMVFVLHLQGRLLDGLPDGTQKERQDLSGSPGAPPVKRLKAQFRCSKCGFVTDDSARFQEHIPQHKTDENTPQCLHCGLCFTSVLSLNRHLFIVHKVKGPGEEDEEGRKVVKVRKVQRDNQPVKSAETEGRDHLSTDLAETAPSQGERPVSVNCETTVDCGIKVSAHSNTQAVASR